LTQFTQFCMEFFIIQMSFVLEMSIKDEHDLFCHNYKMYYDYVESIVDYEHFEVILCINGKKV